MPSVLIVSSLPDERLSTTMLRKVVAEMESRKDVEVEVWFLRTYSDRPGWPGSRDVDALRRWVVARTAEGLLSRRVADLLRGLRLRVWYLRLRPDVVLLDDGLGERVIPRIPGVAGPVVAARRNRDIPAHSTWEPPMVGVPDFEIVDPGGAPDRRSDVPWIPLEFFTTYPTESLEYHAARRAPTRRRLGVPVDEPLLIGWGDDGWLDGPDLFVRAIWALEYHHGRKVNGLWMGLGTDQHEIDRLHAEAERCGVGGRFFQRPTDTLAARFCGDVAFLPYRGSLEPHDIMSTVLSGLPVVTFDAGGLDDPLVAEVAPLDVEAAAAAADPFFDADRGDTAAAVRHRQRFTMLESWVDAFLAIAKGPR